MRTRISTIRLRSNSFNWLVIVSATWLIGLSIGVYSAIRMDIFSLMLTVLFGRMSIVCHVVIFCVPILMSYVIIKLHNYYLLLPLVFCRSFSYAWCAMNIRLAYGYAGWLISGMLLLADSIACCVVCNFWFCAICKEGSTKQLLVLHLCLLALIGFVDYYAISPFVESLLNV